MGKKPETAVTFFCGRCSDTFKSKQELREHMRDHPDTKAPSHKCPGCAFFFQDLLALERHQILNNHREPVAQHRCDRCTLTFSTQREYQSHREHGKPCCDAFHSRDWKKAPRPGYTDPDRPSLISKEVEELQYGNDSTGTPSDMSTDREFCHYCKKTFVSQGTYVRHLLGCTALNTKPTPDPTAGYPVQRLENNPSTPITEDYPSNVEVPSLHAIGSAAQSAHLHTLSPETLTLREKAPASRQPKQDFGVSAPSQATTPAVSQASSIQPSLPGIFVCTIKGCQRSYKSEQGLKRHKTDAHGVGGKGLDLHGTDSWMLGQSERERLRAEGLLRATPGASRGGNNSRGKRGRNFSPAPAAPRTMPLVAPTLRGLATPGPQDRAALHVNNNAAVLPLPTSQNVGGSAELEQAKSVCSKTLRLLLQTDVFIHHNGKMSVGGIDWTRVGVDRQPEVVSMFEGMCHLPRKLQALEYVPAPKTFLAEYKTQYPVTEFESAPTRDSTKPALSIIAIACSKIMLTNKCYEVVKIAAIDVLTCRVLMSHLVCTDPNAQVINWYSPTTGIKSFRDMEDARQAGYKVLKGWSAARSALFRFIDKETIIVGHNLRAELDALRIIHGRAVDIAKVVEKAAQGPLSKVQVSLDSWCRDVANVARLTTDPVFGRDCVMTAFAAREIGLWSIKNRDMFEQVAKQKTREYRLVMKD